MIKMRNIIRPKSLEDISYGIDLHSYFYDSDIIKLVQYDPNTLMRTGDKVVYHDKIEPIYEAKVINAQSE